MRIAVGDARVGDRADGDLSGLPHLEHQVTPLPRGGLRREEVHLGRAEEPGHEQVGGVVVEVERRADLLDDAAVQHHDPVAEGHGLDLVVGHVDHRRAQLLVELGELDAHLHAQGGVEVGERLVEEEHLGLAHDGAADGHALPLAAGELAGRAVQQVRDLEDLGGLGHGGLDLVLGAAGELQAEAHVLGHGHVRVEGVALEHHRRPALGGRDVVGQIVPDVDVARGGVLQAGDDPQQRGLPAARRTDEHHELAVLDLEVHTREDLGTVAEGLVDSAQPDACHEFTPFSAVAFDVRWTSTGGSGGGATKTRRREFTPSGRRR